MGGEEEATGTSEVKKVIEAFLKCEEATKDLNPAQQERVLRAVAALHGLDQYTFEGPVLGEV